MNNQALQIGTTLQGGKYTIKSVLGKGGFGITYLAYQNSLNRKVAVKEFFMKELNDRESGSSLVTIGTTGSRDTIMRYRDKFTKEASSLARLQHPNIVHVIDVFQENGTIYYAMEYAEGGSLADKVSTMGRMPERMATHYILQVAEALSYIHKQRINHLDIKPGNIMVGTDDTIILIDFGLSKHYDAASGKQTSTTPVGISEGYAPMEQYRLGGVGDFSPETDIYALGATFFKLLTGQTPPSSSEVFEQGLPLDQLSAVGASAAAINVISRAMRPKKAERLSSAQAFIDCLKGSNSVQTPTFDEDDESTRIIANPLPPQPDPVVSQPVSQQPYSQPASQQPYSQPASQQPYSQPISEPVSQPYSQPISEPVSQPYSQPISEPVSQPYSQPISEPVSQPISQPISQPGSQPFSQPGGRAGNSGTRVSSREERRARNPRHRYTVQEPEKKASPLMTMLIVLGTILLVVIGVLVYHFLN